MKWCCTPFENHYQIAGERGIAVILEMVDGRDPTFLLQARAFDRDKTPAFETSEPMSLITETAIDFCPWCGRPLAKWYAKHLRELVRGDLTLRRPS